VAYNQTSVPGAGSLVAVHGSVVSGQLRGGHGNLGNASEGGIGNNGLPPAPAPFRWFTARAVGPRRVYSYYRPGVECALGPRLSQRSSLWRNPAVAQMPLASVVTGKLRQLGLEFPRSALAGGINTPHDSDQSDGA